MTSQRPGGLVDQQGGQLPQRGPELGVAAALVAHDGEPGLRDRMVDDDGLACTHRAGAAYRPGAARAQRSRRS